MVGVSKQELSEDNVAHRKGVIQYENKLLNIEHEMQNFILNIAVNDRVLALLSEECQTEGGGIGH